MADKPLPRPRQVTFSGWSIVVGSVLTILYAFQRVAELGSLEAQQAAADFISTPPGDGLGLGVDDVQTAIRIMCLVAGGTAAATAILGWQVLQASRSARVVLSVLAPILFVSGLTSGGIFSALVAAAVVMLWVQPARDWFNGVAPVRDAAAARGMSGGTPYPPTGSTAREPSRSATPPPTGSSWDLPHPEPATSSGGTLTDEQLPDPYGAPSPSTGATSGPARPGRVLAAVLTTMVASSLTFIGLVLSVLYISASRAEFIEEVEAQIAGNAAYEDLSPETIADVAVVFLVVLAVWCLLAMLLAAATLRGSNAARIGLVVSSALSALVSLLGALVIVPLLLTIASIATIVLLFTGGSNEWFAARKRA